MQAPISPQKGPYIVELKTGEKKAWCACGYSESQPFCNGNHAKKETGMSPLIYTAEADKKLAFCGCKHTKTPPFCDGTHKTLQD